MDERLRDLERRAAAGDPAAREELGAARRRAGGSSSVAAVALLAAYRERFGREHDPTRPVKLEAATAAALIEALYLALEWKPVPGAEDVLLAPDGDRRLVWNEGRRSLRRERLDRGAWIRDARCDPHGETLHATRLALRYLDEAVGTGRVTEEAVECGCGGSGWLLRRYVVERCPRCGLFPDDRSARDQALLTSDRKPGSGWTSTEQQKSLEVAFWRFLELVRREDGPKLAGRLLARDAALDLSGERLGTARGPAAVVETLQGAGLTWGGGTLAGEVSAASVTGEVAGVLFAAARPGFHLGRLRLELSRGLIVRVEVRVDRPDPAQEDELANLDDRGLIEALGRLTGLSPVKRIQVEDLRRLVATGRDLSLAQRLRARELLRG